MSKFVKDLLVKEFSARLDGIQEALLVNVVGLTANQTVSLRRQLREQDIQLLVVRNSLARRATQGTPLAHALHQMEGNLAFVWGRDDFVDLAKQIVKLEKSAAFPHFATRGGVMEGEQLTAERVKEISTWPSREEQLSILMGQTLAPARRLSAAMLGPGAALASQLKQKAGDQPQTEEDQQQSAQDRSAQDQSAQDQQQPAEATAEVEESGA